MKFIKIHSKKYPNLKAIVDNKDYNFLNQYHWHVRKSRNTFYVWCLISKQPRRYIEMQRLVLGNPKGLHVDHKNGNCLDNRRHNLRKCTQAQNNRNKVVSSNNKIGIKGVWQQKNSAKYRAKIEVNGRVIHLGYFDKPKQAALAYNQAAVKYHGEFARLNPM